LEEYLPRYNKQFNVQPKEKENMYRKNVNELTLYKVLCTRESRKVKNDNAISYESNLYQIMNHIGGGKTVQIENRMNQNLKIVYKEKSLNYQQLPSIIRKADISNLALQ